MGKSLGIGIGVALLTGSVMAQTPASPKPAVKGAPAAAGPKTSWGEPDLRGTYTTDNSIGVPFERPPQYGDRVTLTHEEVAAKERANNEQVAKDNNDRPGTAFEEHEAA